MRLLTPDRLGASSRMADAGDPAETAWMQLADPFGAPFRRYGNAANTADGDPLARFPGQWADPASGLNYNTFRDYDPALGRYTTPDPIGLAGGDVNLYAYVAGDPVNSSDAYGLRPLNECEKETLKPYIPKEDLDNADIHDDGVPWWVDEPYEGITLGNDIYFRPNVYDPSTAEGLALLGHELVHVGQYRNGGLTRPAYDWEAIQHGTGRKNKYEKPAYDLQDKIRIDLLLYLFGAFGGCKCTVEPGF